MSYSQALEEQLAAARYFRAHGRDAAASAGESVGLLAMTAHALSHGDPYYWSQPICESIEQISSTFPDSYRLSLEDLPGQAGFFLFTRPLLVLVSDIVPLPDGDDTQGARISALSWGSVENKDGDVGIGLCAYLRHTSRQLAPYQVTSLWPPDTIRAYLDGIIQHADTGWDRIADCAQLVRLFCTCIAFMRDRILIASHQRAERHARKRAARDGFTHEPLIRVVELRRAQARSERSSDAEPVDWSHQWIVSGHWRQQWHPTLHAHQPCWIMPHVKGPPEKPLKPPRAKVFAVVR